MTDKSNVKLTRKRASLRIFAVAMIFFAVLLVFAAPAAAEPSGLWTSYTEKPADIDNPIELDGIPYIRVDTAEELAWLVANAESNNYYKSYCISLVKDIDLSAHYWVPFDYFKGTFNGNDNTISGMYVSDNNLPDEYIYNMEYMEGYSVTEIKPLGFISKLYESATVTNLNVVGSITFDGVDGVTTVMIGGIVGSFDYESTDILNIHNSIIKSSSFTGEITISDNDKSNLGVYAGGIVGNAAISDISNCSFAGNIKVTSTVAYVGGIVGKLSGPGVNNCVSAGTLSVSDIASDYGGIGGIAGESVTSVSNCVVYCENIAGKTSNRIIGTTGSGTDLSNNKAWAHTKVNNNEVTGGAANNINGVDIHLSDAPIYGQIINFPDAWIDEDSLISSLSYLSNAFDYTVTFYNEGGSTTYKTYLNVVDGATIGAPTEPTKTGYTFDGWYTAASVGTKWDFNSDRVCADQSLYQQWLPNEYTLSLYHKSESCGLVTVTYDSSSVSDSSSFTAPEGYTLEGWYTNVDTGVKVLDKDGKLVVNVNGYTDNSGNWKYDGSVNLFAKLTPTTTKITFLDSNGGKITSSGSDVSIELTYGAELPAGFTTTLISTQTKDGHTFKGWGVNDNGVDRLIVSYTNGAYSLVSDVAGYTGNQASSVLWQCTKTDLSLSPIFEVNKHAVTTRVNSYGTISVTATDESGSTVSDLNNVPYDSTVTVTLTANNGYEYDGNAVTVTPNTVSLTTESSGWSFTMPDSDVTVSATFTPVKTTITLKDGELDYGTVTATYASATLEKGDESLSFTPELQEGYAFMGWYSALGDAGYLVIKEDGSLAQDTAADSNAYTSADGKWEYYTGEVTLYAKWVPVNTALILISSKADETYSYTGASIDYGSNTVTAYPTDNLPKRSGYSLEGWSSKGELPVVINATGSFSDAGSTYVDTYGKWIYTKSSLSLFAVWEEKETVIKFANESGSEIMKTVTDGDGDTVESPVTTIFTYDTALPSDFTTADLIEAQDKKGHTFKGWGILGDETIDTDDTLIVSYEDGKYTFVKRVESYTEGEYSDPRWIYTGDDDELTLSPIFEVNYYTITISEIEHGTVTVKVDGTNADASETYSVPYDSEVTLVPVPNNGYEYDEKAVTATVSQDNSNLATYDSNNKNWSFNMPDCEVTVSAEFTPVKTEITLKNGEQDHGKVTATYASDELVKVGGVTSLIPASQTGYTFMGWYTDADTGYPVIDNSEKLVSDSTNSNDYTDVDGKWEHYKDAANGVTLYAKWNANETTVSLINTFDNEESGKATLTYESDTITVSGDFTYPTKDGYTLIGWSNSRTAPQTQILDNTTNPLKFNATTVDGWTKTINDVIVWDYEGDDGGEIEFYTIWVENTNTVYTIETYLMNTTGAYELNETVKNYGTTGEQVSVTSEDKTGFTFNSGESTLSGSIAGDGSLVLKLYYDRNQYTFKTVADETENSYKYYYEAEVTAPDNPVKEGYTFTGWDNDIPEKMPANDVTLTAQFIINSYTLTVNTTNGDPDYTEVLKYAESISIDNPARTGYDFTGWAWKNTDTGVTVEKQTVMPAYNLTATAQWKEEGTSGSGSDNTGGSGSGSGSGSSGGSSAIIIPGSSSSGGSTTHTITFDANGGTGTMNQLSVENGKTASLTKNTFTREGYTFAGWALSANGELAYKDGEEIKPERSMTLYALWVEEIGEPTDTPIDTEQAGIPAWVFAIAGGVLILIILAAVFIARRK